MTESLLCYEDFRPGETAVYGRHVLTREEIVAFAGEFDPQPFHLEEDAGAASLLGGLAASGWHACALLMRLNCEGFLLRSASMGAPGIEEVAWLRPLRPGAVLSVQREILDARVSGSRPQMGLVRFRFTLCADGRPAMRQVGWIMIGRREGA